MLHASAAEQWPIDDEPEVTAAARKRRETIVSKQPSTSCAEKLAPSNRSATSKSSADSLEGRPPLRPRARAACNPAKVRSRISERSNSASAPKI